MKSECKGLCAAQASREARELLKEHVSLFGPDEETLRIIRLLGVTQTDNECYTGSLKGVGVRLYLLGFGRAADKIAMMNGDVLSIERHGFAYIADVKLKVDAEFTGVNELKKRVNSCMSDIKSVPGLVVLSKKLLREYVEIELH